MNPKLSTTTSLLFYYSIMGVFAFFFITNNFLGLEAHSGYFGLTFKILHPEYFSGEINSGFHLAMVSLWTPLVKLAGDLWLDDRFNFLVCFGLAFLSLLGIDRITRFLGITEKWGRLAVLSILLMDHRIVDNIPGIVDSVFYRPSSYAAPIGIWLGYFLLKKGRPLVIFGLCFLLVGFSFKNGWFPVLTTIIFLCKEYLGWKWPRIVTVFSTLVVLFFLGYYFYGSSKGILSQNAFVFDYSAQHIEGSEAHPFLDGFAPYIYVPFIVLLFFVRFPDKVLVSRIRTLAIVALSTYLLGGMYYSFAPDSLKIPFLMAMAVSRSTWFPQILSFIIFSVYLIQRMQASSRVSDYLRYWFLLFILYLFPMIEYSTFGAAFDFNKPLVTMGTWVTACMLGSLSLCAFIMAKGRGQEYARKLILFPMVFTTILYYGYRAQGQLANLEFLAKTGVMGGTAAAQWVGVNEYLRNHIPPGAMVVAFSETRGGFLAPDSSVKVRSGVSMPVVHEIADYFNYDKIVKVSQGNQLYRDLEQGWQTCNLKQVEEAIYKLGDPRYLIVPTKQRCSLAGFSYSVVDEVGSRLILKK